MHRFSLNLLDIDIDLDALAKNSIIPYIGINDDTFISWSSIKGPCVVEDHLSSPIKPDSKPN